MLRRHRPSPEEARPPVLETVKEGDTLQDLVDIAERAFATAEEFEGKHYVRIPIEDPNYMMTLASGLWVFMDDGSHGRANEMVIRALETSLGWTVDMMSGASITDPESGVRHAFLGVTVSHVTHVDPS